MGLTVVVAGRTAPNRAVRFGGEHDRLDERGRRDVAGLAIASSASLGCAARVGPEASVLESARLLMRDVEPDPTLASLDVGRWRGRGPEEIPAGDLSAWFTDPSACPHGGETIAAFVERVLAAVCDGDCLIVASPVAQAILAGSPEAFFDVEVRSGSVLTADAPSRGRPGDGPCRRSS